MLPGIIHSVSLYSPDKSRETMIYEQNLNEIFDGEHQYINYKYGKYSMLEIYDESFDTAVLFLHGRGLNPNEQNLAYPVRVGMSDSYNTYSLQLPVLKKQSTYLEYTKIFYDSDERILSAIEHIYDKNKKVIVIAHSCGVHMLMSYIKSKNLSESISSLVLIGSGAVDKGEKLIYQYPYDKIKVPVLDLYGENDFDLVLKKSVERNENIKKNNTKSQQIKIKSSDHYHADNSNQVITFVKKWLSNQ
jgi:pimeloyl-ACP methyl ester carboxylesterase